MSRSLGTHVADRACVARPAAAFPATGAHAGLLLGSSDARAAAAAAGAPSCCCCCCLPGLAVRGCCVSQTGRRLTTAPPRRTAAGLARRSPRTLTTTTHLSPPLPATPGVRCLPTPTPHERIPLSRPSDTRRSPSCRPVPAAGLHSTRPTTPALLSQPPPPLSARPQPTSPPSSSIARPAHGRPCSSPSLLAAFTSPQQLTLGPLPDLLAGRPRREQRSPAPADIHPPSSPPRSSPPVGSTSLYSRRSPVNRRSLLSLLLARYRQALSSLSSFQLLEPVSSSFTSVAARPFVLLPPQVPMSDASKHLLHRARSGLARSLHHGGSSFHQARAVVKAGDTYAVGNTSASTSASSSTPPSYTNEQVLLGFLAITGGLAALFVLAALPRLLARWVGGGRAGEVGGGFVFRRGAGWVGRPVDRPGMSRSESDDSCVPRLLSMRSVVAGADLARALPSQARVREVVLGLHDAAALREQAVGAPAAQAAAPRPDDSDASPARAAVLSVVPADGPDPPAPARAPPLLAWRAHARSGVRPRPIRLGLRARHLLVLGPDRGRFAQRRRRDGPDPAHRRARHEEFAGCCPSRQGLREGQLSAPLPRPQHLHRLDAPRRRLLCVVAPVRTFGSYHAERLADVFAAAAPRPVAKWDAAGISIATKTKNPIFLSAFISYLGLCVVSVTSIPIVRRRWSLLALGSCALLTLLAPPPRSGARRTSSSPSATFSATCRSWSPSSVPSPPSSGSTVGHADRLPSRLADLARPSLCVPRAACSPDRLSPPCADPGSLSLLPRRALLPLGPRPVGL